MEKIRNFVIMAHVDHGKSTLADRLLEITGTVRQDKMKPQFLDKMELERERGITIKLKPVRMNYKGYVLNLVDTPGHVDFSYEVSRALAAVEGTVLLVDVSKGIQAQTLANLDLAKKQGLTIIPAVNKIDMPQAQTEKTIEELAQVLSIPKESILKVSGKMGTNAESLLERILTDVPEPKIEEQKPFRSLIFDSEFDSYKGIIAYVRVVDGTLKQGQKIRLLASLAKAEAKEVGYFKPQMEKQGQISAGEIGYIATGIKEPGKVRVGDTIALDDLNPVLPLPGYKESVPMIFASFYPEDPDDFDNLKDALAKLKLSDPSFVFEQESKEALGRGFKCGFLGTLHTEIVSERLKREFGLSLVISSPSVVYQIEDIKGKESFIYSATEWPEQNLIKSAKEPWVKLEIIIPLDYMGGVSEILSHMRADYLETKYLGSDKIILVYEAPLAEIITNLYDKLKGASKGYASMSYQAIGLKPNHLVKLEIMIAGEPEEAFAKIVPEEKAYPEGKAIVEKLKETLPNQQFSVALQAVVGGKVVARETIKARRKDVTGYLYGGDYSRKRKLLEKQKKGKKLLKEKGKVNIPPDVFLKVFKG